MESRKPKDTEHQVLLILLTGSFLFSHFYSQYCKLRFKLFFICTKRNFILSINFIKLQVTMCSSFTSLKTHFCLYHSYSIIPHILINMTNIPQCKIVDSPRSGITHFQSQIFYSSKPPTHSLCLLPLCLAPKFPFTYSLPTDTPSVSEDGIKCYPQHSLSLVQSGIRNLYFRYLSYIFFKNTSQHSSFENS